MFDPSWNSTMRAIENVRDLQLPTGINHCWTRIDGQRVDEYNVVGPNLTVWCKCKDEKTANLISDLLNKREATAQLMNSFTQATNERVAWENVAIAAVTRNRELEQLVKSYGETGLERIDRAIEHTSRDRAIFDAGFRACRSFGDNHAHYHGEQADRVFASAMEEIR